MLARHGKRLLELIDFEFFPADDLLKALANLLMCVELECCILLVLRKLICLSLVELDVLLGNFANFAISLSFESFALFDNNLLFDLKLLNFTRGSFLSTLQVH